MQELADDINKMKRLSPLILCLVSIEVNLMFTGDQLQEKVRSWLHYPDPSTNHNTALRQHHNGTAAWFTQRGTFKKWRETGSLLWIHGKHMYFSDLSSLPLLDGRPLRDLSAGSGKSVLW